MRPGTLSPKKVSQNYIKEGGLGQPPKFDDSIDYYKEFWRMYLQNENLVADIDQTSHANYKMSRKIFNTKDFYENTLIPQILTQPHKFLHRLRQQQHQQRLILEAKERQVRQQQEQHAQGLQSLKEESALSLKKQQSKRKKHLRRTAGEIDRTFVCPYDGCQKYFGSEGS